MPYLKSRQADSNVELYYEDWGSGRPLIFIHGWPSSHRMWDYQTTYFAAKGYRVIAHDRRGFGQSFKPWEPYDYTTLAADLKLLIDELQLEDVTLIGFSMGGGEVARYCHQYQCARVKSVVLVSTILPFLLQTQDNPNGVPRQVFDGFIEKILDDRPAFLKEFGKGFFGETFVKHPLSQAYLDWAHGLTLQASVKGTIDCIGSFSATDFRKELASITVPALVIHGNNDKIVPIEISSDLSSNMIPGAKYIVYDGAPHGLFATDKDRLSADIAEFLQ